MIDPANLDRSLLPTALALLLVLGSSLWELARGRGRRQQQAAHAERPAFFPRLTARGRSPVEQLPQRPREDAA